VQHAGAQKGAERQGKGSDLCVCVCVCVYLCVVSGALADEEFAEPGEGDGRREADKGVPCNTMHYKAGEREGRECFCQLCQLGMTWHGSCILPAQQRCGNVAQH